MKRKILITGSTGFIGRRLLAQMLAAGDWDLRVLVREQVDIPGAEVVVGDLLVPDTYKAAVENAEIVVHLAAMTGKASPSDHDRLNRKATEDLIAICRGAGVTRFIFISTIAAGYADKSYYSYARSKQAAEDALSTSGLCFDILRPTIVLGEGSPTFDSLSKLARMPLVLLPQRNGPSMVQPVHVDDVCRGIIRLVQKEEAGGEILELGGPEVLSIRQLLNQISLHQHGKNARFLQLPLRLVQWPLAFMEPILRPFMPVTAGQFAVFGNDSVAHPNWLGREISSHSTELYAMLAETGSSPNSDCGNGANISSAMKSVQTTDEEAFREAQIGTKSVCNIDPVDEISRHYLSALDKLNLRAEGCRFDQFTLKFSRRSELTHAIVSSYSSLFGRRSSFWRRQVLLIALLENHPQTHHKFDNAYEGGSVGAVVRLLILGASNLFLGLIGVILFLPVKVIVAFGKPHSTTDAN